MPVRNNEFYQNVIAISNRSLCHRPFLEQVRRVCELHPKALILREKDLDDAEYKHLALQVMPLCEEYRVRFIAHSHVICIRDLDCRYLHLPLPLLRIHVNELKFRIHIGCSVHSLEEAEEAEYLGADYLIAGHIYDTHCKRGIPPRGVEFLGEICRAVKLPVYAIGGIRLSEEQFLKLNECGAQGGCVMSDMMKI